MAEIFDLVREAENRLGWYPAGKNIHRARAGACVRLERTMTKVGATPADVRLAIAWCWERRHPIEDPAQLVGLIERAKEVAAVKEAPSDLALDVTAALAWEAAHHDEHSDAWTSRLVRSVGPLRAETLAEWKESGRGDRP